MSVRITYRIPVVSENAEDAGQFKQMQFDDLANASGWISVHIPETERPLVKMWVDDILITGAALEAAMRPLPPASSD